MVRGLGYLTTLFHSRHHLDEHLLQSGLRDRLSGGPEEDALLWLLGLL
jgi:hypothetical protein